MARVEFLRVGIDSKPAKKGAKDFEAATESMERSSKDLKRSVGVVDTAIAGLGGALGAFKNAAFTAGIAVTAMTVAGVAMGRQMIESASEAEETESKFRFMFESIQEKAITASERTADLFGRSVIDIQNYEASFANLLIAQGNSEEMTLQMSEALARLSIDFASLNNMADDEAVTSLLAALTGEFDSLKRLGPAVNDARLKQEALTLGIVKSNGAWTAQQKTMLALSIIAKDASKTFGDAIRTQSSFTNQLKKTQGGIRDLSTAFGARLITSIQQTVKEMGGVDKLLEIIAVGMEVVVGITETMIRATGKLLRKTVLFVEALGGQAAAIEVVQDVFSVFVNAMKALFSGLNGVFILMIIGIKGVLLWSKILWLEIKRLTLSLAVTLYDALLKVAGYLDNIFNAALEKAVGGIRFVANAAKQLASGLGFEGAAKQMEGFIATMDILMSMNKGGLRSTLAEDFAGQFGGTATALEMQLFLIKTKLASFEEQRNKFNNEILNELGPALFLAWSNALAQGMKAYEGIGGIFSRLAAALGGIAKDTGRSLGEKFGDGLENAITNTFVALETRGKFNKMVKELIEEQKKLQAQLNQTKETGEKNAAGIGKAFGSAAEDAILKFESLRAVLRGLAEDVLSVLIRNLVTAPLASGVEGLISGSAKGNVFGGSGNVESFAKGGFINSTAIFPMAGGGIAEVGEQGREYAAELTRTAGGDLAVKAQGGRGIGTVNMIFPNATNPSDFFESKRQIAQQLNKAIS